MVYLPTCTIIYHKNQPNVGKYTMHGSYVFHNLIQVLVSETRWFWFGKLTIFIYIILSTVILLEIAGNNDCPIRLKSTRCRLLHCFPRPPSWLTLKNVTLRIEKSLHFWPSLCLSTFVSHFWANNISPEKYCIATLLSRASLLC